MKKLLTVIAVSVMLAAIALFAGNTGIEMSEQKHGYLEFITYTFTVDNLTVAQWNQSSADALAAGDIAKAYTFDSYMEEFCAYFSDGGGQYYIEKTDNDETQVALGIIDSYSHAFKSDKTATGEVEESFFTYKYTVVRMNPLLQLLTQITADEEPESGTIAYVIRNGLKKNGKVVLPAFTDAFPAAKNFDIEDQSLTYYQALPMWVDASSVEVETVDGVKCAIWTYDPAADAPEQLISYSYYVPNSTGWGITIGIVSCVIVLILFLVFKYKDTNNSFADFRTGDEYEVKARVEEKIRRVTEPENPENAYTGNGVFMENGKTVDVFGNEAYSAPVATGSENAGDDSDGPEDIFGN